MHTNLVFIKGKEGLSTCTMNSCSLENMEKDDL